MAPQTPLIDRFGRIHTSLRVSVTDRCNIRCSYCMPSENVQFRPRSEILTYEEITRFVKVVSSLGVNKIRLTGGEPTLRADLPRLVAMLNALPGIHDLALTTNGLLLSEMATPLKNAGLRRVNISLDTLKEDVFLQVSRRKGLARVLAGIAAACAAGFEKVRLNAVSLREFTEHEAVDLVRFARDHQCEMRFIEFMPLDAEHAWQTQNVLTGAALRSILEAELGPLVPIDHGDPSQPSSDFRFANAQGIVGFINPVSQPFCETCNRLRLTAEGQIRNCLFSTTEWDARAILRSGASDEPIVALIRACVEAKKVGHGIDSPEFLRPERAMYQIGG